MRGRLPGDHRTARDGLKASLEMDHLFGRPLQRLHGTGEVRRRPGEEKRACSSGEGTIGCTNPFACTASAPTTRTTVRTPPAKNARPEKSQAWSVALNIPSVPAMNVFARSTKAGATRAVTDSTAAQAATWGRPLATAGHEAHKIKVMAPEAARSISACHDGWASNCAA
jgi:hypothetical protein